MSSKAREALDRQLLKLDPAFRAEELDVQVKALRRQRDMNLGCIIERGLHALIARVRHTR